MKTLTTLFALAILSATASAQTIKALGYDTASGEVVANTGTNTLTFTNSLGPTTFNQAKITKLETNAIGPRLILDNTAGNGEGAIDFYTIEGQGGPETDNPSARWYVVDDGDYSAHQYFQTKEGGQDGTEMITRLAIRTDGNVGIGVEEPTTTLDVAGNMALRDTDGGFAATFDVQEQLSGDVTLTIPDQSGTIAVFSSAFTGNVIVDTNTLVFTNGILIEVQ
jgi:hypothetical protein